MYAGLRKEPGKTGKPRRRCGGACSTWNDTKTSKSSRQHLRWPPASRDLRSPVLGDDRRSSAHKRLRARTAYSKSVSQRDTGSGVDAVSAAPQEEGRILLDLVLRRRPERDRDVERRVVRRDPQPRRSAGRGRDDIPARALAAYRPVLRVMKSLPP